MGLRAPKDFKNEFLGRLQSRVWKNLDLEIVSTKVRTVISFSNTNRTIKTKFWQMHTSIYSSFELFPRQKSFFFGKTILTLTKALFRLVSVMWHHVPFRSPCQECGSTLFKMTTPPPEYYSSIFKTIKICFLFQSCDHHVNKITQLDWEKVTFVNLLNSNADTEQIVTQK